MNIPDLNKMAEDTLAGVERTQAEMQALAASGVEFAESATLEIEGMEGVFSTPVVAYKDIDGQIHLVKQG